LLALNDRIRGLLPEVTLTEARRARLMKNRKIDHEGQAPHRYPFTAVASIARCGEA
jgi:hypothetical protein